MKKNRGIPGIRNNGFLKMKYRTNSRKSKWKKNHPIIITIGIKTIIKMTITINKKIKAKEMTKMIQKDLRNILYTTLSSLKHQKELHSLGLLVLEIKILNSIPNMTTSL